MDWLKTILETATVTDGKLDVAAVMTAISAEFPKHAVPKSDYNDKVTELRTANLTIADLKKENGDNADLQKKVQDYETEIGNLKKAAADDKKTYALKEKLVAAGAIDADYLIYSHGGLDKFTFDKDGAPIGIEDIVKPLKESKPHLFKADPGPDYNPAGGSNPPAANPWKKETYNLTEQGRIYKENPAQAKQLAAAAGVTI